MTGVKTSHASERHHCYHLHRYRDNDQCRRDSLMRLPLSSAAAVCFLPPEIRKSMHCDWHFEDKYSTSRARFIYFSLFFPSSMFSFKLRVSVVFTRKNRSKSRWCRRPPARFAAAGRRVSLCFQSLKFGIFKYLILLFFNSSKRRNALNVLFSVSSNTKIVHHADLMHHKPTSRSVLVNVIDMLVNINQ